MIKSIELDPYEEWNPCNSPDIVNFSQCHSENRRNQYRRKPVQRPIGGKLSFHTYAHTYVQNGLPKSFEHNMFFFSLLLLFGLKYIQS